MKLQRSYTPKDVAARKWTLLDWDAKWRIPFGRPAENASWFICGRSASGKSSFVMQLGKRLCQFGGVLYVSYEEGVNQSFQRRMNYLHMDEVQRWFRVITKSTKEELIARLSRPKSPKFVIIDSFQVSPFEYPDAVELMERFPKKCFVWVSQEAKSEPMGKGAVKLKYICDMKVRVVGYKAYCQGRETENPGCYYPVWPDALAKMIGNRSDVLPKRIVEIDD